MIFDHCLAPDTDAGSVGCDNMTLLVVGITHGRTKEGWYKWIKERVKNDYGYKTPSTLPQLYTQRRLISYRERREAREKMKTTVNNKTPNIPKARRSRRFLVVVAAVSILAVAAAYRTNMVGMLSALVAKRWG